MPERVPIIGKGIRNNSIDETNRARRLHSGSRIETSGSVSLRQMLTKDQMNDLVVPRLSLEFVVIDQSPFSGEEHPSFRVFLHRPHVNIILRGIEKQ